jgi:hypothetical protein
MSINFDLSEEIAHLPNGEINAFRHLYYQRAHYCRPLSVGYGLEWENIAQRLNDVESSEGWALRKLIRLALLVCTARIKGGKNLQ